MAAVCGIVGGLLLWEGLLWANVVTPLLLPHAKDVGRALISMLLEQSFWVDVSATITSWLLGVLAGSLGGGLIGIMIGLNRYVWGAVEPWVEFFRALPSVVMVPLVSLFLGVGTLSRIVCCSLVVLMLMVSTAAIAVHSARNSHLRLARAWRATTAQLVGQFYLPAVAAHMAVALRAAIPLALIVAVAADMLIATDTGLGKIILDALAVFDSARMYAAILVVGALGYAAAIVSARIERRAIHWSAA